MRSLGSAAGFASLTLEFLSRLFERREKAEREASQVRESDKKGRKGTRISNPRKPAFAATRAADKGAREGGGEAGGCGLPFAVVEGLEFAEKLRLFRLVGGGLFV